LSMGMTKEDIIARATSAPAKSIKRADLGQLSKGAVADVSVLSLRNEILVLSTQVEIK